MNNKKPLPKIPKHLAKQGVRWVEVADTYISSIWLRRLWLEEREKANVCVHPEEERLFLAGEIKYPILDIWEIAREIEQPEEEEEEVKFSVDGPSQINTDKCFEERQTMELKEVLKKSNCCCLRISGMEEVVTEEEKRTPYTALIRLGMKIWINMK